MLEASLLLAVLGHSALMYVVLRKKQNAGALAGVPTQFMTQGEIVVRIVVAPEGGRAKPYSVVLLCT